jgi:uncharacterized Tic20 family protein
MADSWVGKPCPKCKHVRGPNEVAPDWQCPKCGVAYAKFIAAQQGASATVGGTARAPSVGEQLRAGQTLKGQGGGGSTGLAMFAHLSILIGFLIPLFSLIVPIVIWITKKDSDQLATANAKEVINFQITMLLWIIVMVGVILFVPIAGFVLAVVIGLAYIILPIIAAVKANGGEEYKYPATIHIFG